MKNARSFFGSAGVAVFCLFALVHLADVLARPALFYNDFPWFLGPNRTVPAAIRDVVCYSLLAVVPVFLFGRWARLVLVPFFCYAVVAGVAVHYAWALYKVPLGEFWPAALSNSSGEEIAAFLKMSLTPGAVAGLVGVLLVLAAGAFVLAKARYPRVTWRTWALGLLLTLPFGVFNLCLTPPKFGVREMLYSDFVVRSALSMMRMKGLHDVCSRPPRLPERLACAAEPDARPNVVFVIGESSTRNDWHLYGYPRQTTPRMDALCGEGGGGVCFRDVVSAHGETTEAVGFLLSDVSFDNPMVGNWTLSDVYRRAGYRGTLITNQFLWRFEADQLLSRIFRGCEARINVADEYPQDRPAHDAHTAELLARVLRGAADDAPQVVFVHLAGAHFPVENANPKSEDRFSDAVEGECLAGLSAVTRDRVNRYDNAILYGDKVLGMLVDALKAESRRPSCLVFISDHGESPRNEYWRNHTSEDVYEVPFVIWFSDAYRERFPDVVAAARRAAPRPLQGDELVYGLAELGRITGIPGVRPEQSFLHPDFKARFPRQIDKGRAVYSKDLKSGLPEPPVR